MASRQWLKNTGMHGAHGFLEKLAITPAHHRAAANNVGFKPGNDFESAPNFNQTA
jgi:hypothetical protein